MRENNIDILYNYSELQIFPTARVDFFHPFIAVLCNDALELDYVQPEKGKPFERVGRKATGLRLPREDRAAGLPEVPYDRSKCVLKQVNQPR